MHLFLFLLTFFFTQTAHAFKIKVIDSTLELDKGMNSTTATVVNDSENMIAIEATALVAAAGRWGKHLDGDEGGLYWC